MSIFHQGAPFHGEFASADASALTEPNSRFALYGTGAVASLTLDSNDQVIISEITIASAGTNLVGYIYDGADATVDAGESVWRGIVPTNTTQALQFGIPHYCQKGTYPKVKMSGAGQIYVSIRGTIFRKGA